VTLTWSDNADNETGFIIERAKKIRGKYIFVPLADTVPADTTTFTDSVEETGDYKYRIRAINDGAESDYSNEILVKVDSLGTTPDPTPGLSAPVLSSQINGNSVTLSWNDVCPDNETCTYTIERGDAKIRGNINFSTYQVNYLGLSETHTETSGTYYFRVKVKGSDGTESDFSNVVATRIQ
jgi:hypothetical protein